MIDRRQATHQDSDFVYFTKKEALGPYVEQTWGWDEQFQQKYHRKDFDPSQIEILQSAGEDIGVLAVTRTSSEIQINEIYIVPRFQRRGFGTHILQAIIEESSSQKLPIRLQFLKVNPVRSLYERLGFKVVGETEHHYLMERNA